MAERPDPDTDRRNILPGEHAKPDGTWCPYLAPSNEAGVWVCMKCGNSGGVSTPDTDPNTLADRLDNGWMLTNSEMRAAADGLRQYAAITAAIGDLHRPMWDDPTAPGFYQTEPHREGDPAIGCCTCGTDGWPCPTAASLSPTPTPEHCPTCGSTNRDRVKPNDCEIIPDAWHDSGQP